MEVSVGFVGFGISFLSLGLGGLISFFMVKRREFSVPILTLIAAGLLFYQIFARLLLESIKIGGALLTFLGLGIGIVAFMLIEKLSKQIDLIKLHSSGIHSSMLIVLAATLHNLPTGLIMGSLASNNSTILPDLYKTMAIHSLPEGLALGLSLASVGLPFIAMVICIIIASMPTGVGVLFTNLLGSFPTSLMTWILGLAMGTMIYIAIHEMVLPLWKRTRIGSITLGLGLGIFLGTLI